MILSELFLQSAFLLLIILFFVSFVYDSRRIIISLLILISILGVLSITLRGFENSRFPVVNLYESLIFISVLGVFFLLYVFIKLKNIIWIVRLGLPVLFLILGVATILPPWDKTPHYLIPALQSYWLYIHVTASFVSYSGFTVAFILGILFLFYNKKNRVKAGNIEIMVYKIIAFSFPVLTFGIFTGAIWANYAWGSYWSWDPKETWSLVTWIIYAGYLHTRIIRGWRGRVGIYWVIAGFIVMVFTFIGVNYLLPGLHSYL